MFGLFRNNNTASTSQQPQPWMLELKETQERWFTFLDKMEARMEELCLAAIPELKALQQADDDPYKRNYHKIQAGIKGQLENMRNKAYDTYEEKINELYYCLNSSISTLDKHHRLLVDFRLACSDRYHHAFEAKYTYWSSQLDNASCEDLEIVYRNIIAGFEAVKDKFACKQCGAPITIEKLFLISAYLACPACNTQNTFEPGTQARSLQHIAQGLAEQRTAHLLALYENEQQRERDLYHQIHTLRLSIVHERDKKILAQRQEAMDTLEEARKEALKQAPILKRQYLRAMYDEWNRITPDLKEHNEIMYRNSLS